MNMKMIGVELPLRLAVPTGVVVEVAGRLGAEVGVTVWQARLPGKYAPWRFASTTDRPRRPSRSVPSSPTPPSFGVQTSRQPYVAARSPDMNRPQNIAARNPETNRSRGRAIPRGNLSRSNWHPPVASYIHTLPRGPRRGRTPPTSPSSVAQPSQPQVVTPAQPSQPQVVAPAQPSQPQVVTPVQAQTPRYVPSLYERHETLTRQRQWAPRGLATPETFLSGYATVLGENTARAGATLPESHEMSKLASEVSDSAQVGTAVETADGSENSQVLERTVDSAQIVTATETSDGPEKSQAVKDTDDSASMHTAEEATKRSESPEALIDTSSVDQDENSMYKKLQECLIFILMAAMLILIVCVGAADIVFSEEIDEAPVGLRVHTPTQASRDSYTNDLLGLELQPETQTNAEITERQGSLSDLDNNADDLRQVNAESNMTEAQARLAQLSALLPTLAPAEAIARLMALTTLFDAGAVVPPGGQVKEETSNAAATVIKDQYATEEASNAALQAPDTEKTETVVEATSHASMFPREPSQGATGHQDMDITIDPRVTHAANANNTANRAYAGSVAEARRNEWTSNVVARQEVVLGRPPMSGNLQHSEHYPGVYVSPKDDDIYAEKKQKDRIIGEHNRAIGRPGSVSQDKQITEGQDSSVKEADSDELADKLSQLQLGDEGVALVNPFERKATVATTSPAEPEQPLPTSPRANTTRLHSQDDSQPPRNPFQPQRAEDVRLPVGPAHRPTQPASSLRTQSIHRSFRVPELQVNGVRIQGDRGTTPTEVNDPFVGDFARPNFRMRATPSFPDNAITRQYTQRPRPFDMRLLDTTTTLNTGRNVLAENQTVRLQASTTLDLQSSRHAATSTEAATADHRAGSVSQLTTYDTQGNHTPDTIPQLSEPVEQTASVLAQFRFATQNPTAHQISLRERRARGRVISQYPSTGGHRLPHEFEPSMASYRRPTIQQLPAWLEADLAAQTPNDAGSAVRAQYAGASASSNQPRTATTPTPSRWDNLSTRSPELSTIAQNDTGVVARTQYGGTVPTGSNLQAPPSVPSSNRRNQLSPRAPVSNVPAISDPGAAARAQYGGVGYGGPGPANTLGRVQDIRNRENQTPIRVINITPVAEAEEVEEAPRPFNKDPWSQARNRQL